MRGWLSIGGLTDGWTLRQSQCLVKVGAHTAAAVLYQCFAPEEFKYGLRILQLAPEAHDEAFFQYFWEVRSVSSSRVVVVVRTDST